ncbi:uncharacterized protein LOC125316541 [Rhodamnia argentea]|uniref:Uncharacterized protein LOC125316541 n=1 Tax=Rhodamnia argentea TaxID=178133 RepID=A0ABM3HWY5_9MYRT|nr:uncharacterized protein LOC125316541 [Rhodamnia argentea]
MRNGHGLPTFQSFFGRIKWMNPTITIEVHIYRKKKASLQFATDVVFESKLLLYITFLVMLRMWNTFFASSSCSWNLLNPSFISVTAAGTPRFTTRKNPNISDARHILSIASFLLVGLRLISPRSMIGTPRFSEPLLDSELSSDVSCGRMKKF